MRRAPKLVLKINYARRQGGTVDSGLAFLTVRFSDGSTGVLTVSCRIPGPPAAPPTLFEGIRVSMGFVDYWNGDEPPAPPANGNRTLFHIVGKG